MQTLSPRTPSLTPNLESQKPVFEEIFDTYMLLGDRAYRKGEFDAARKMYLAAWQEICPKFSDDCDLGTTLHNLGKLFLQRGFEKKAEVLLKKSMDTFARNSDCNQPFAYENAGLLARLAAVEGKFPRAEKLAKRQWLISKRIYGKDDQKTKEPIKFLVQLYRRYGKFERADALERLVRSDVQTAPPEVYETQSFAPDSDEAIQIACSDQSILDS